MTDTPCEPVMVWQFLRRYFVRIVIGAVLAVVCGLLIMGAVESTAAVAIAVLAVAVCGLLIPWMRYRRKHRIARAVYAHFQRGRSQYSWLKWVPRFVRYGLPWFGRIPIVQLVDSDGFAELPSDVETLAKKVSWLCLGGTQVTDAGLEYLNGLTNLKKLWLNNTQVTDAGLEHLKGLTNLRYLFLIDTQVTAKGRAKLREELPSCWTFLQKGERD